MEAMKTKIIELEFTNFDKSSSFCLTYDLVSNDFTERWTKSLMIALRKEGGKVQNGGNFYGKCFYHEKELRESLQECINLINSYEKKWIDLVPYEGMDQNFLMKLHEFFERLDPIEAFQDSTCPKQVSKALYDMNLLIHKYESLLTGDNDFQVELHFEPVKRYRFKDSDYQLFTPQLKYGTLYLAYGITGVPPLVGFLNHVLQSPVSQNNYTVGMQLYFGKGLHFFESDQWKAYLHQHGLSTTDPHLAVGYIPLAHLNSKLTFEEIKKNFSQHRVYKGMSLTPVTDEEYSDFALHNFIKKNLLAGSNPYCPTFSKIELTKEAHWPTSRELFWHLDYVPWLMLPIEFDYQACLEEAMKLMDQFVVHRNYDQESIHLKGQWKSLALHAVNGDKNKTLNHFDYQINNPEYKLTEVAHQCPTTMNFLSLLTDFTLCERIRFMLLEPGAMIKVHSDGPGKDVTLAVNIALNMPEECEFIVDCNEDGSFNEFTRQIPIKPGSLFLFNNSKFHYVKNNSTQPRLHLILHGPIKLHDKDLIQIARKQNELFSEKQIINELIRKKSKLGIEISKNSSLFHEWLVSGVHDGFSEWINIAVINEDLPDKNFQQENNELITAASLFPHSFTRIKYDQMNTWLNQSLNLNFKYSILMTGGTYLTQMPYFMLESIRAASLIKKSGASAAGHIIHHSGEIPYFHEQYLIVDLEKWKELGEPSLASPDQVKEMSFPAFLRSKENIHDDYTPLWLMPDKESKVVYKGKSGYGSEFMSKSLAKGYSLINVPLSLRETKMYAYPRSGRCWQYQAIREQIDCFLKREKENIFVFNNENLNISSFSDFYPQIIISVASGFKPYTLTHQFLTQKPEKCIFIDSSLPAIKYQQEILSLNNRSSLLDFLCLKLLKKNFDDSKVRDFVKEKFASLLRESFHGDEKNFWQIHSWWKNAEFQSGDFISDPELILQYLEPGKQLLFWHSNAWSSNVSYFLRTLSELKENYKRLALMTGDKLQTRVWLHKHENELIFGPDPRKPQVVFTSGFINQINKDHYEELV